MQVGYCVLAGIHMYPSSRNGEMVGSTAQKDRGLSCHSCDQTAAGSHYNLTRLPSVLTAREKQAQQKPQRQQQRQEQPQQREQRNSQKPRKQQHQQQQQQNKRKKQQQHEKQRQNQWGLLKSAKQQR
eukprot:TRINITY_DN6744_c0_g2_i1.p2 TRINITY_DN6744_c0_g2~~TRINITY_DN6744_c0_g2_i1.p2  ORF type:complete len:127 (-),score=26.75 TRINITY_DN6744_c0_g2_i1:46-426(-)